MQDLVEINSKSLRSRAAIGGSVLIALILAGIAISFQFGNLLAEQTTPGDINAHEIAMLSASLAAEDPRTHNLLGLTSQDPNLSVGHFETAVKLAPHDYRWRVALGRAYEQVEMVDKAESQLRAAAELAPNYAFPRWHLGNFFIRQGREDEAVDELRRATVDHFSFREQVFALAWDYSSADPAQAERMTAESPETRAYFSRFLANRGQGPAALRVWNQLDEADKQKHHGIARWTILDLYSKGNFAAAHEIARQIGDTTAVPETISNPSFEELIVDGPTAKFGWEIVPGEPRVEIGFDNQVKSSGNRSLRVSFRNLVRSDFINVYQTVIVRPDTSYMLKFSVRTEGLRSAGRPRLQIVNANDNSTAAMSEMFASDLSEWTQISVTFRTGPVTRAISIRTFRQYCGDECSASGVLWYDDFELLTGQQ